VPPETAQPPLIDVLRRYGATAAVAVTTLWLGYQSGGYSLLERAPFAIAVWWAVILAVILRFWPRAAVPRAALVALGLLAGFAAWTAASMLWAPSVEDALLEFDRVTLYLGVLTVAVVAVPRGTASRWADGLAIGIVGVAVIALVSRLFPGSFSLRGLPDFLPAARTRLSFPVDYWNGLGILIGLSFPLLLRAALDARNAVVRGLALAPLPAVTAALYLTASRGGFGTAVLGAIVLVVLAADRWRALAALAIALLGSAGAIAMLLGRHELVDGPVDSAAAESQGRSAALLLLALGAAVAIAWTLASRLLPEGIRLRPRLARALAATGVAVVATAVVLSDPLERFDTFRQVPTQLAAPADPDESFVRAHLLSGNGSGRWQFWTSAVDEFQTAPLEGRGAGTYESWWAEHASFSYFVRDAHSLYLETLGELGLVGLFLLGGALVTGVVAGFSRLPRAEPGMRTTIAALLGALFGFLFGAAVDWVWELTAVSAVGIATLGLLTGPGTLADNPAPTRVRRRTRGDARFALAVGGLVAAWIVLWAQVLPLLSDIKIRDSQAAVRAGDTDDALSDAQAARRLQPWAAAPHLQLALVLEREDLEQDGDFSAARRQIEQAIERDRRNWNLWLVKSRLETFAGRPRAAAESYERARSLNPRSPLFAEP
jgi:O-Antigen ligase